MADCSAREWASDKAGLLASIAPHTGLGGAGAGGAAGALSFGSLARADAGAHKTAARCLAEWPMWQAWWQPGGWGVDAWIMIAHDDCCPLLSLLPLAATNKCIPNAF